MGIGDTVNADVLSGPGQLFFDKERRRLLIADTRTIALSSRTSKAE